MENQERLIEEVFEATRLLGRNSSYIRKIPEWREAMIASTLKTMMAKTGNCKKDEKGRPIATVRVKHYVNTAFIALKISQGLFPKDKDFTNGVALAALAHDLGQWPFGHDGDEAAKFASKENNGGPRLHNIEGMDKFRFRYSKEVINAINSGRIISEESKKRGIAEQELRERIERKLEPEIDKKIQEEIEKNGNLPKKAVEIMAMAIGNHNGERGTANIVPDYTRTFEEVCKDAEKTYFDAREDKNMISCNIVDAIVKISDQISSITYDIIDGKRSGIEDEIYEGWADPISKVLQITEEEATLRLKGNDKELNRLALDLQDKLIESVVRSSDKTKINMDLAPLLYGVSNETGEMIVPGLRTFNMTEHIVYTSSAETEVLLNNMVSGLTDKLSEAILDENGTFYSELNEVFRISSNNPLRRIKEKGLIQKMNDNNGELKDFYKYIVKTSPEEYNFNKKIVKKRETQYFRKIIEKAASKRENIVEGIDSRSLRNSTAYLVEEYMVSPSYESMTPDENGNYSDEEIKIMLDRINTFLKAKPVEKINHLSLLIDKHKYILGVEGAAEKISTGKRKINTDQQIAARLAIGYINTLSDKELIELAGKLEVLKNEDKKAFTVTYDPNKKENPYNTKASRIAAKNYEEGANKLNKGTTQSDDNEYSL